MPVSVRDGWMLISRVDFAKFGLMTPVMLKMLMNLIKCKQNQQVLISPCRGEKDSIRLDVEAITRVGTWVHHNVEVFELNSDQHQNSQQYGNPLVIRIRFNPVDPSGDFVAKIYHTNIRATQYLELCANIARRLDERNLRIDQMPEWADGEVWGVAQQLHHFLQHQTK